MCCNFRISYRILLDQSVIVSILFGIHMFCFALSLIFLVFCFLKRKFGTFYEGLLHAYLLSILLMALTSLFAVMFLPLAFLQQSHSLGEGRTFPSLSLPARCFIDLLIFFSRWYCTVKVYRRCMVVK
ncbi:hypothetical protein COOONC_14733 [Cooperia oncophora]